MSLALPLGLLGLLSIVGLVLIYILKPKYQDKKVASTYVWKLSLKYAKRKVPWQWLRNSLLFLIQLLIFVIIALMMAGPFFYLSTTQGEKIVILDASASMLAEDGGRTRFDRAKSEIGSLADVTTQNDRFTVILAGEDATFLIRRSDSAGFVRQKLSETECTLSEPDLPAAMALAEQVLSENPNAEVHLFTDAEYEDSGRVTVHNMSGSEWNAAILNFTASRVNGQYVFTAQIASYGRAAEIAVNLNVDGRARLPKLAMCEQDGTATVVWDSLNIAEYESADVHLQGIRDSFVYDNDYSLFNPSADPFRIQLVSSNPGFLQGALSAAGSCDIVVPEGETPASTSGFDLYVFDGTLPDEIPTDGAVWLIAPPQQDAARLDAEWGIGMSVVRGNGKDRYYFSPAGGTSEIYRTVMRAVDPRTTFVTEYSRLISYDGYESMILCEDSPVLLTRNDGGLKTVVFAFDLHKSDLPIHYYYPLLISNLYRYSIVRTVERAEYAVGEAVQLNAKPNALQMTVSASFADGTESEEQYSEYPVLLTPERLGEYTVTQTLGSARTVTDRFYVRLAGDESVFGKKLALLTGPVTPPGAGTDTNVNRDTLDVFVYLGAALLVIVCVEWGLQYREQF